MKLINYQDPRPIYEQIVENYKTLILKKVLVKDEQLPSVRQLAVEESINPNTVQKAYTELERQGFIYTVKGKGKYVGGDTSLLAQSKTELAMQLNGIFDKAAELGISRDELLEEAERIHA